MLVLVLLGLLVTCCAAVMWLAPLFEQDTVSVSATRLQQLTRVPVALDSNPVRYERMRGYVGALASWLRSHTPVERGEALRQRLASSGYSSAFALDMYTSTRMLLPALAAVGASFSPVARPVLVCIVLAVSYFAPSLFLRSLTRRRRARIRKSMPDMIDLLVICVDAGLGLDQAVARVADELHISHPDLGEELVQVGREQRAGKLRMQAWKDLATRLALPEMDAFVSMILQAERFGTPIARALSNFANLHRQQRTQRAEENAAKTTVKIIFPLVLFIFPCIFIVLLGPAALTMIRTFAGGLK